MQNLYSAIPMSSMALYSNCTSLLPALETGMNYGSGLLCPYADLVLK